jgi:UDP-glucuronate 4-epimerase
VNVNGTLHLLHACRERGVKRIVFASSSSVYGLDSDVPFSEFDPCGHPMSPYAATKRAGELMAFNHHHLYGATVTCLRFFTVYGPRQRPDLAIHKFTRLIAAGQPIELFGDGTTSRDYTWIDDILDGVVAAIDQQARDPRTAYRIYNLGGSRPTSLRELVDRISSALGKQGHHRMEARGAGRHEAHPGRRRLGAKRSRLFAQGVHRGRHPALRRLVASGNQVG